MNIKEIAKKKQDNQKKQDDNVASKKQVEQEFSIFDSLLYREKQLDEACLGTFYGHPEQKFFEQLNDDRYAQEKQIYQLLDDATEELYHEKKKFDDELDTLDEEEQFEKRKEQADG